VDTLVNTRVIRFGDFELDLSNRELRRQGALINLQPQAFRVLALLASRPNRLVRRTEITNELWPEDQIGDLDNRLNFEVKKIREALHDDAERPRFVKTVRKGGYKFIAAVEPEYDDAPTPEKLPDDGSRTGPGSYSAVLSTGDENEEAEPIAARPRRTRLTSEPVLAGAALGALAVAASLLGWRVAGRGLMVRPVITAVSPIAAKQDQQITIEGHGFGHYYTPLKGLDTPYLAIGDDTGHWAAGRTVPQNADDVTLRVRTWTDTEIVIDGFAGEYGQNGWMLKPGDIVKARVWNPQTGAGPAEFYLRVVPPLRAPADERPLADMRAAERGTHPPTAPPSVAY
jgi:DNA-binding winged helix-turn-helix (wHTH) protein